jgi:hypothetical protein
MACLILQKLETGGILYCILFGFTVEKKTLVVVKDHVFAIVVIERK